jgi:hypothetical protein
MLSFSYSEYNDEHPIPIVELFLENPNNSFTSVISRPAILDTGADYTLLPLELVRDDLKLLPVDSQKNIRFKGVGSHEFESPMFVIGFSFDNKNYIKVKVAALSRNIIGEEIIVGRNILNHYIINFDAPKLVFTISDYFD